MAQKITQMRLARYLFTAVLALLFVNCSKGRSYKESQPSHVEQTTSSNQADNKISTDDYELSTDGLTLIKWYNHNTKNLDLNHDPRLSKIRFIGDGAFMRCKNLTSINIPSSVTSIGREAFTGCSNLTSINIPSSVTSIGDRAFSFCSNLTSINIPSSVTSIGEKAFAGCRSLTSIHIPSSVTRIGESVFWDCINLTIINIPSSITSIGGYAFSSCRSLTSVTIPSSVTSIGSSAFWACSNLTSVVFKGNNPPKIADSASKVFEYTSSNLKLIVPKGAKRAYIKAGYPEDRLIEQ